MKIGVFLWDVLAGICFGITLGMCIIAIVAPPEHKLSLLALGGLAAIVGLVILRGK